jgi:ribosomal protein S25
MDTERRGRVMAYLYRAGWINLSHFLGDGSLLPGELLRLTDAGRSALQETRDRQDTKAADPPGVSYDEKRRRRSLLMKELYDRVGANTGTIVSSAEIGSTLGWDDAVAKPVVRYLAEKGLIKYGDLEGGIALTLLGLDEVERAASPSPMDTEHLARMAVTVGNVSGGVVQVVQDGADHHPPPSAVGAPPSKALPQRLGGWLWVIILGALGSLLAAGIIWAATGDDGGTTTSQSPPRASPTSAAPGSGAARGEVILEYAGNRNGSPVFADPTGRAVAATKPSRIPFGTPVNVRCKAPNRSGIASVSAFYLIADGEWAGDSVVADTMTNGGEPGVTDTPNVDPRVPDCP